MLARRARHRGPSRKFISSLFFVFPTPRVFRPPGVPRCCSCEPCSHRILPPDPPSPVHYGIGRPAHAGCSFRSHGPAFLLCPRTLRSVRPYRSWKRKMARPGGCPFVNHMLRGVTVKIGNLYLSVVSAVFTLFFPRFVCDTRIFVCDTRFFVCNTRIFALPFAIPELPDSDLGTLHGRQTSLASPSRPPQEPGPFLDRHQQHQPQGLSPTSRIPLLRACHKTRSIAPHIQGSQRQSHRRNPVLARHAHDPGQGRSDLCHLPTSCMQETAAIPSPAASSFTAPTCSASPTALSAAGTTQIWSAPSSASAAAPSAPTSAPETSRKPKSLASSTPPRCAGNTIKKAG